MDRTGEPFASPHDPGLLAAYVEGRLDDEERRVLTLHLGACADCRQALAMLARVPGALPIAAKRRTVASPAWLALAATVLLAIVVVRRTDAPVAVDPPASTPSSVASAGALPTAPPSEIVEASPRLPAPAADPMLDPGLLVKRGATQRQVGGKTFRLVAGEWVDLEFDSRASLPTMPIRGDDERAALVQRIPALGPYAGLGNRVVVVFDGTVYRLTP
jgi:hypothetical protein